MTSALKVVTPDVPTASPAALERQAHEAALAALDADERTARENIRRIEAARAPITALAERRAALEEQEAQNDAAAYLRKPAPHDSELLQRQLAEVELEEAARKSKAKGASLALEELHAQLVDISKRRAAEIAKREAVQRAQHAEHLAGLAASGEHAIAQFLQWYVEAVAAAIVHDHIKAPADPFTAAKLRTKFTVPVPFGLPAFDSLGAERDLGVAIQQRAEGLLHILGVEVRR